MRRSTKKSKCPSPGWAEKGWAEIQSTLKESRLGRGGVTVSLQAPASETESSESSQAQVFANMDSDSPNADVVAAGLGDSTNPFKSSALMRGVLPRIQSRIWIRDVVELLSGLHVLINWLASSVCTWKSHGKALFSCTVYLRTQPDSASSLARPGRSPKFSMKRAGSKVWKLQSDYQLQAGEGQ
jgi:hypothetical protein